MVRHNTKKVWAKIFDLRVGLRVRVINIQGKKMGKAINKEGNITRIERKVAYPIYVRLDSQKYDYPFLETELEIIEDKKTNTRKT